jgi:hypothetical protein
MLHQAHFDVKGGKPPFAAIANLNCAYSESGPPTGGYNAFPFRAAAVGFEHKEIFRHLPPSKKNR